jgi:hypothetical protein
MFILVITFDNFIATRFAKVQFNISHELTWYVLFWVGYNLLIDNEGNLQVVSKTT